MEKFFGGLIIGAIAGALGVYVYNEYQDDLFCGSDIGYSGKTDESEDKEEVNENVETEFAGGV
jgi:hypothetical protein